MGGVGASNKVGAGKELAYVAEVEKLRKKFAKGLFGDDTSWADARYGEYWDTHGKFRQVGSSEQKAITKALDYVCSKNGSVYKNVYKKIRSVPYGEDYRSLTPLGWRASADALGFQKYKGEKKITMRNAIKRPLW